MVGPDTLLVALTSTRCEPDRLVSVHPSRFSAASTRAALAMDSTVGHGYDITGGPSPLAPRFRGIHRGHQIASRLDHAGKLAEGGPPVVRREEHQEVPGSAE